MIDVFNRRRRRMEMANISEGRSLNQILAGAQDPDNPYQPQHPRDFDEPVTREIPYAPTVTASLDPVRIASISVKSVAALGQKSTEEIQQVIAGIQQATQEVVDKLNQLCEAIKHHTNEAAVQVEALATKTTTALEGVRQLHDAFHKPQEPQQ